MLKRENTKNSNLLTRQTCRQGWGCRWGGPFRQGRPEGFGPAVPPASGRGAASWGGCTPLYRRPAASRAASGTAARTWAAQTFSWGHEIVRFSVVHYWYRFFEYEVPVFPMFLHKSLLPRSLRLPFKPFRFWPWILGDIHIRKLTPRIAEWVKTLSAMRDKKWRVRLVLLFFKGGWAGADVGGKTQDCLEYPFFSDL